MLDTNVVSSVIAANGAPSVKAWSVYHDERVFYLSVLTLAEYDKGIANLPPDDIRREIYTLRRDALEARFAGRILSVSDAVARRWGEISGRIKRETGHPPQVIDTLLAATAIEANLFLTTRNVRDVAASGAAIFDPWKDNPADFVLTPRRPRSTNRP